VVGVWLGGSGLCCAWIGGGGSGLCHMWVICWVDLGDFGKDCWVNLGGAAVVGWWVWVVVVLLMMEMVGGGGVDDWQVIGWFGLKGGCVGFWVCSQW